MAGVAEWMLPGQVSDLVEISEGHPLVLTYMIEDLRPYATELNEEKRRNLVGHMLSSATEYRGSVDQRYSHYLGSLAKDDDVFAILGTVCRLRIPVDLEWLKIWIDASAVTRFADLTHTFFRREGNEWTFIHNSFRRFLVDQTATVGGHIRDWRSRELHEQLADHCASSADWPQYRDEELVQRYLAGQFQRVLDTATPANLRAGLFSGRPYGVVRDQAVVVLRAATEARDYRAMIRSLMFLNELQQRDYVIDADTMAKTVSYIDLDRAVEHVVRGRSLRLDQATALGIAADLAANGSLESAESIVRAVGGLRSLVSRLGHSHLRPRELEASIADWAEVQWYRSGLDRVLDELDHLLPFPEPLVETNITGTSDHDEQSVDDAKNGLEVRTQDTVANPAQISGESEPGGSADDDTPDDEDSESAEPLGESATEPEGRDVANSVDRIRSSVGRKRDDDLWRAEREARELREARAAIVVARNAIHARCFDLATNVRDSESLSRLAERINAESDLEWRARTHAVVAGAALQDGNSVEVLRQVQLLLLIENPAHVAPGDLSQSDEPTASTQQPSVDKPTEKGDAVGQDLQDDGAPAQSDVDRSKGPAAGSGVNGSDGDTEAHDDEKGALSGERISLGLRVFAANALAMSGQAGTEEFRRLLPANTKLSWPSPYGTSDGLKPYTTMLLVLRVRELHNLIGIYDTIPDDGLKVPNSGNDPGRMRFATAMNIVAKLEAQAAAFSMGLVNAPDVPAFADPVIRLLEVPHVTARRWTGWYQIVEAGIELITVLVSLAHRCGGAPQMERLLARFSAAWANTDRVTYWPARRRVAVVRAAAAYDAAAEWCRIELDKAESFVFDEGDPHSRATTWLEVAKARSDIADDEGAVAAIEHAHRNGWGPGQSDKDYQLVTWLSWLTDAADLAVIDQTTFVQDAYVYAARLFTASGEADTQASDAAGRLIIAVFQRSVGFAIRMAEALCSRGVIAEAEMITAVVTAAAQSRDIEPDLVSFLLTELLMPLSPETPHEIERYLLDRCTDSSALKGRFVHARSLWSTSGAETEYEGVEAPAGSLSTAVADDVKLPLVTVLGQMRTFLESNIPAETARRWSKSIEQSTESVSRIVAVALLEQVERLDLGDLDVARTAGIASRAGAATEARDVLSRILARTTPFGWQRNYDGGSRIRLFEAAVSDESNELVDLAARDLAGLVASKAVAAEFSPQDLKRFAQLFGGPELVAKCWADIRDYLDVFVPASDDLVELRPNVSDRPELELIAWTAQHLGHPIRIIDFGARRVLAQNYTRHRADIDLTLTASVSADGWPAEAALKILVKVGIEGVSVAAGSGATSDIPTELSPGLISALQNAAVGNDVINRHLATRVLSLARLDRPTAAPAQLPAVYGIELPPLPEREIPELDHRGVPFIDTSNPQQVIAPYDDVLRYVADYVDMDSHALYYRGASLGQATPNWWTDGGHNAHAERLMSRRNLHVYRPWAYMVGRRGCARVLAELIDARFLPRGLTSLWIDDLSDDILNWIAPQPLDSSTPVPWRAPDSKDYASEEWCEHARRAAEYYAEVFPGNYVLCEISRWRWLTWETPEEIRHIRTRHGEISTSKLLIDRPVATTVETTVCGATNYPNLPDLSWSNRELVVRGRPYHSDPERVGEWLALHPAAAEALGWIAGVTDAFEWIGNDGGWRARSVFRVRGQLDHRPPLDTTCAEVWQVVLSHRGWTELAANFTNLQRTVSVSRVLEASRGKQRDRIQQNATVNISDVFS